MAESVRVVGAVIVEDGAILAAQRGPGMAAAGLWEFPGGKLEVGETPAAALAREVEEELGCKIEIGAYITTTTHAHANGLLTLSTYYARIIAGEPRATEHAAIAWLPPANLGSVAWTPADIPAAERIVEDFSMAPGRRGE